MFGLLSHTRPVDHQAFLEAERTAGEKALLLSISIATHERILLTCLRTHLGKNHPGLILQQEGCVSLTGTGRVSGTR